jgi:hypothetical protein
MMYAMLPFNEDDPDQADEDFYASDEEVAEILAEVMPIDIWPSRVRAAIASGCELIDSDY